MVSVGEYSTIMVSSRYKWITLLIIIFIELEPVRLFKSSIQTFSLNLRITRFKHAKLQCKGEAALDEEQQMILCDRILHIMQSKPIEWQVVQCVARHSSCYDGKPLAMIKFALTSDRIVSPSQLHTSLSSSILAVDSRITIDYLTVTDYNECDHREDNSCPAFSKCKNSMASYRCVCVHGYRHIKAGETMQCVKPCGDDMKMCQNSGFCHDSSCICQPKYTGRTCELTRRESNPYILLTGLGLAVTVTTYLLSKLSALPRIRNMLLRIYF